MEPVLSAEQVRAVDASAIAAGASHDELVERAGFAVAIAAQRLLGGSVAGRRIVVLAGKGSNGADGRVAARRLSARGAAVVVVHPTGPVPPCDLVVDAAFGTGLSRPYPVPTVPAGARVLAVDLPSGLDADLGSVVGGGRALEADATVTFACRKPGLLLGEGRSLAGTVEVADIGLSGLARAAASQWLVTDGDVDGLLPKRPVSTHKWRSAVLVVAGSPAVRGAPQLATSAAMHAGAGYVALGIPGLGATELPVGEHVGRGLPSEGWEHELGDALDRCAAVACGPGLGRTEAARSGVRALLASDRPIVLDADALHVVDPVATSGRAAPTVLTPHDGELKILLGRDLGPNRLAEVREVAQRFSATVLSKGSTTVVVDPSGEVRYATAGDARLATAGTGDVLSGIVAAFLASGLSGLDAASLAAHVHGRAAHLGHRVGLVAGDLPPLVASWLSARG